jgi:hypothetical protein
MTKLCINCKYHKSVQFYSTCNHPELQKPPNPVDGKPRTNFCEFERYRTGKCGPDAKYYEECESIFDSIKSMFRF